jgi:hypothetical protein
MKDIHFLAVLGGAAALVYFATRDKSRDAVRQTTSTTRVAEGYALTKDPSGAPQCINLMTRDKAAMAFCNSPLEGVGGYFSVGALTGPAVGPRGRRHRHETPCCSGCAHGRGCEG